MKTTINFLIFLALGISSYVQAQNFLAQGLVAHYPMDGDPITVLDVSGNNHHGKIDGAIPGEDRFGNPVGAYFLDGTDDQIILKPSSNDFKPALPVTITAWVQLHDYDLNNVFQNDFHLGVYHGPWMNIVDGYVSGQFGDGGPAGRQSRRSKTGSTQLKLEKWYHIAAVIRGEQDISIYVDGKDDGGHYSGSGGSLTYSNNDGIIGVGTSDGGLFYHGHIDDIRFYNRALSSDEIQGICEIQSGNNSILTRVAKNPFSETLVIKFENAPEESSARVSDLQGNTMAYNPTPDSVWEISTIDWPTGMYVVQLYGKGRKEVKKVFKLN